MFDVLHDSADDYDFAVGNRIDVHFDRALQITIDQQWMTLGGLQSLRYVTPKFLFIWDNFHRATAQHIRRPDQNRITHLRGARNCFFETACQDSVGLLETEARYHRIEPLAIFRTIDRVRSGSENGNTCTRQRHRQLERRLSAELHDYAEWLFTLYDRDYIFERQRLEVETIRDVVVG